MAKTKEQTAAAPSERLIKVPTGEGAGFRPKHVEVGALTERQADGLKSLLLGLVREKKTLARGNMVHNGVDAIRWILEELSPIKKPGEVYPPGNG